MKRCCLPILLVLSNFCLGQSVIDFAVSGECIGTSLQFTYTGPANFTSVGWYFGDPASGGANLSSSPNPTHDFSVPGVYLVNLTVYFPGNPNATTITKQVRALTAPAVNLGNDTTLCENDSLILHVPNNGSQIQWQDNSSAPSFVVHNAGVYYVTVTDQGCIASDSILVSYILLPKFTLGPDLALCGNEKILLAPTIFTDTTGLQYAWQDGSPDKTFTANQPGVYSLGLTNSCGTTYDTVKIIQGYCTLQIPSAFTPNGDGHNDLFRAKGDHVTKFNMTIYNRWGQRIFASDDINKGWDGYFQGRLQPSGTYVFTVIYSDDQAKDRILNGTFMLIY